jgi:hypothetical protein
MISRYSARFVKTGEAEAGKNPPKRNLVCLGSSDIPSCAALQQRQTDVAREKKV